MIGRAVSISDLFAVRILAKTSSPTRLPIPLMGLTPAALHLRQDSARAAGYAGPRSPRK
jgi:hypothetical protein